MIVDNLVVVVDNMFLDVVLKMKMWMWIQVLMFHLMNDHLMEHHHMCKRDPKEHENSVTDMRMYSCIQQRMVAHVRCPVHILLILSHHHSSLDEI